MPVRGLEPFFSKGPASLAAQNRYGPLDTGGDFQPPFSHPAYDRPGMSDALVGVLVGWGLSTATQVGRVWWDRRTAASAERTGIRQAARLIEEELLVSDRMLSEAFDGEHRHSWPAARRLPGSVWNEQRVVLAGRRGKSPEWTAVAKAYAEINELNWAFGQLFEGGFTPSDWNDLKQQFEDVHALIAQALTALRDLIRENG